MRYILDFDIAAVILSCITIFLYYERKQRKFGPGERFARIAWVVAGSAVTSLVSSLYINRLPAEAPETVMASVTVFYLFHNALPFTAALYILHTGGLYPVQKKLQALFMLPWALTVAAVLTNPWTKLFSFVDSAGTYRHGPLFYGLYVLSLSYFVIVLIVLVFGRSRFTPAHRRSFLAAALIPILAIIAQSLFDRVMLECFGASISAIFVLITIQNESELLDGQSGLYHRESFIDFLGEAFARNERFSILIAYSAELADLQGTLESNAYRNLVEAVSKWLSGNESTASWIRTGVFALLFEPRTRQKTIHELTLKIAEHSDHPWNAGTVQVHVPFKVLVLHCPQDAAEVSVVMDCFNQLPEITTRVAQRILLSTRDFSIGKYKRGSLIGRALDLCLEQQTAELAYQPVYSINRQYPVALEVLIGVTINGGETVTQSEVFDIAEKMGVSRQLAELVMKSCFDWYVTNNVAETSFSQLQIRVPAALCLDVDWPHTVLSIAEKCRLNPARIALEVTETTVSRFGKDLLVAMDFLSAKGVSFILDDFGSGYTNLVELNTMPFSLIKFDKKIIQPGLKTLKGSKILEGMVDIFKRNGAMVAAEGVEAGEQAGTLALMNFDYLQGYYFGKPESGEQLLKNLQATRL